MGERRGLYFGLLLTVYVDILTDGVSRTLTGNRLSVSARKLKSSITKVTAFSLLFIF
jgi:hypothetical protein